MTKILAIEGWGNFPCIKNQLITPLGLDATFRPWNVATGITWTQGAFDIVIGHSLGGHAALYVSKIIKPKYLITLDPRWMSNWSFLDVGFPLYGNFPAVPDVEVHNFIHTPPIFFPGYAVDGAKENTSLFTTHMTIPGHPAVAKCLKGIL